MSELLRRVNLRWTDDELPRPQPGWLACPMCRSPEDTQLLKRWQFFHHDSSEPHEVYGRCNTHWKCTVCSFVYTFGIPVAGFRRGTVSYREADDATANPNRV